MHMCNLFMPLSMAEKIGRLVASENCSAHRAVFMHMPRVVHLGSFLSFTGDIADCLLDHPEGSTRVVFTGIQFQQKVLTPVLALRLRR